VAPAGPPSMAAPCSLSGRDRVAAGDVTAALRHTTRPAGNAVHAQTRSCQGGGRLLPWSRSRPAKRRGVRGDGGPGARRSSPASSPMVGLALLHNTGFPVARPPLDLGAPAVRATWDPAPRLASRLPPPTTHLDLGRVMRLKNRGFPACFDSG